MQNEFIKQTTEPEFLMKYSDFIDAVYEEFRSPGDAEYLNEFGKFLEGLCEERNPKPRINVMRIKQKQFQPDQSSKEEDEERKIEQTREILEKVKEWLEVADDDEEKFNQQYHEYKEVIKDLDVEARHRFYILVDQNRAEVKRKKMRQRNEEPRPRKLYAGAFEGRYHFFSCCKEINKRSYYEWTSCSTCFTKTEGILDLSKSESSSSSDTRVEDNTIEFELRGTEFHSPECTVTKAIPEGDKDTKSMCQACVKEERILAEVRKRNKQNYSMA